MGSPAPPFPGFGRRVADLVLNAVDLGIRTRWEPAKRRAERIPGADIDSKVRNLTRNLSSELGVAGAAGGAVAAVPGVGTMASLGTMAADTTWATLRIVDLVLTIGVIYGFDQAEIEERRAWVLSIMGFGDAAFATFNRLAGQVGRGLGTRATAAVPTATLRSINQALGRTIVTKYGSKQGAVAIGRAFPFGIGAAIGGAANYTLVRTISRHANGFFRQVAPPT